MAFNAEYFGKQLHLSNWLCDEMCQGYGGLPRLLEKTRGETLMCNDQKCKTGEKKNQVIFYQTLAEKIIFSLIYFLLLLREARAQD